MKTCLNCYAPVGRDGYYHPPDRRPPLRPRGQRLAAGIEALTKDRDALRARVEELEKTLRQCSDALREQWEI